MWCVPNLLAVVLGLIVLAILVGLARWVLRQFPDKVDPFLVNVAYVILVVGVVLWLLNAFCLFDNLSGGHRGR